jgi:predicted DNA-binding protein YlxM (UPF0122 family)
MIKLKKGENSGGGVFLELFELLDPTEQRGVRILQSVLREGGKRKVSQLAEELEVNRATIKEDIELLKTMVGQFDKKILFVYDGESLQIETNGKLTSLELYYAYLQQSINYQILLAIYEHGRFSLKSLAYQLMISTATLSRRIKTVNLLLEEFTLVIKNGQLQGTELQIRYFYFMLFWFGRPYHINQKKFKDPATSEFVRLMARRLQISLSYDAEMKLLIWLSISKRRMSQFDSAEMQYFDLLDAGGFRDDLFVEVHRLLAHFYSRYAFEWNTAEAQLLFVFLLAHIDLSAESPYVQQLLAAGLAHDYPAAKLNRYVREKILANFITDRLSEGYLKQFTLELYQAHCLFYYFNGAIYFLEHTGLIHVLDKLPITIVEEYCRQLVDEVEEYIQIPRIKKDISYWLLFQQYINLLYVGYIDLQFYLKIGCDFPFSKSLAGTFRDHIFYNLDPRIKVKLEKYIDGEKYDLIISNIQREYRGHGEEQVYIIFSIEYEADFNHLETFLREYYQKKLVEEVVKK